MGTVHAFSATAILLAQSRQVVHWDLWLTVAGLVVVLAVGTWAIVKVKQWRDESAESEEKVSNADQLAQYEKMAEDGLIEPDELAQIKARLSGQPAPPTLPKESAGEPPPNPPPGSLQQPP